MLASALIKELQEAVAEYGDREVHAQDFYHNIEQHNRLMGVVRVYSGTEYPSNPTSYALPFDRTVPGEERWYVDEDDNASK